MSNYSQFTLIPSCFILCLALFPSYALSEPIDSSPATSSQDKKNQLVLLQGYLTAASNQLQKLSPSPQASNSKNTKNLTTTTTTLTTINNGPIPVDSINNSVKSIKNLVYDPDHPSEFIGKLIAAFSFYLTGENLALSYGQSFLGEKNQIIIQGKKFHNDHRKYLEALKQQESMLAQKEKGPTKQP